MMTVGRIRFDNFEKTFPKRSQHEHADCLRRIAQELLRIADEMEKPGDRIFAYGDMANIVAYALASGGKVEG